MRVELERFDEVLAIVRREFPHLAIEVDRNHKQVDAIADLPPQPGLDFLVSFNLQGDALHLHASKLWVEMFPCGKQRVFEAFVDAMRGLLSGHFRILESYVGKHSATAFLQRPEKGTWKTVASSSNLWAVLPWRRTNRVVQNSERS